MNFENFAGIDKQSRWFLASWYKVLSAYMSNTDYDEQVERHAKEVSPLSGEKVETIRRRTHDIVKTNRIGHMAAIKRMRTALRITD